eukprot:TRINITY_DN28411_c0_g1_i2.p1 TRINITY_DN28411_c0_g1~~TRINITY_DN28411_c0_g1_i2.p1  ORF type:complete len:170 (-),score=40.62 TRINITY_DN28411_c0_g1_i2:275-784(-)
MALFALASMAMVMGASAFTCNDWCQSGNHGLGMIIGTAPFCGGDCNSDCPNGACQTATSEMSDYGKGCASGSKVCCCSTKVSTPAEEQKDILGMEAEASNAFSCSDWCKSGGHGDFGQVIGTAPFCGGDCNSDCPNGACQTATSEMSDYGKGCATGSKVCCCSSKVLQV